MSTFLYDFTIPILTRGLRVLDVYMDAAIGHSEANGLDPAILFAARLASDMMPLSGQVRSACDRSKDGVAGLTGVASPSHDDDQTTFAQLKARIAKTVVLLGKVIPGQFDGADDRSVDFRFRGATLAMTGRAYLSTILLPDFYFHIATTHGILRNQGLNIGKADYLGEGLGS